MVAVNVAGDLKLNIADVPEIRLLETNEKWLLYVVALCIMGVTTWIRLPNLLTLCEHVLYVQIRRSANSRIVIKLT